MTQAQGPGNGPTTEGDGPAVEEKAPTPSTSVSTAPDPVRDESARHFPQTLVAMDPPTLPGAQPAAPPPEFRQFPTPERSVPGHPHLRGRLRRILSFWRRGG